MEFVAKMELPAKPEFNYEDLKAELELRAEMYANVKYTEVELKKAKADRAELNRFKKAINDERLSREREYMAPFNEFKSQVNEILEILDKPINAIDKQIKDFEERQKADKKEEIRALFEKLNEYEWLGLVQIFDSKWLNSSVTIKAVEDAIKMQLTMIAHELESIEGLEYAFEAKEVYKNSLSLSNAMAEDKRLRDVAQAKKVQESKAEPKEEPKVEPVEEPKEEPKEVQPREWMNLEICINEQDFDDFAEWAKLRNIEWRMI